MITAPEAKELTTDDPTEERFAFQLEMLKTEIGIIDGAIGRIDGFMQSARIWALALWAGSLALVVVNPALRGYAVLTMFVPLLFWVVNARSAHVQRGFIYREDKIAEFINTSELADAFRSRELPNGLRILDPRGAQYRKTEQYHRSVSLLRSFSHPEHMLLFGSMMLVSLLVAMLF